jgi:hypothetical protein
MIQELRIPVDREKKAVEYFKYSADWIRRHWECKTCDKREWMGVAKTLSDHIEKYIEKK